MVSVSNMIRGVWLCLMLGLVASLKIKIKNPQLSLDKWLPATATWYGPPDGAGTDGGACGYASLPNTPYGKMVSAGSANFFKSGIGCGECYEVKCIQHSACSQVPIRVVITDEGPGGPLGAHLDLGGFAFGLMAKHAKASILQNAGHIPILYKRVPCQYPGNNIAFEINRGANPFWFSFLIRYQAGDGDLIHVDLMQEYDEKWKSMNHLWGAYWFLIGGPVHGPFSIRLTSSFGQTIIAHNVIPQHWIPGSTYRSNVNF